MDYWLLSQSKWVSSYPFLTSRATPSLNDYPMATLLANTIG